MKSEIFRASVFSTLTLNKPPNTKLSFENLKNFLAIFFPFIYTSKNWKIYMSNTQMNWPPLKLLQSTKQGYWIKILLRLRNSETRNNQFLIPLNKRIAIPSNPSFPLYEIYWLKSFVSWKKLVKELLNFF